MKKLYSFFICTLVLFLPTHAVTHIVTQQGTTFSPNAMVVNVGDTVRWEWTAGTHTTTSISVPVGAATWDSPLTMGNPFFEYEVTVEGVYAYKCIPHESMGMLGGFVAAGVTPVSSPRVNASTLNISANSNQLLVQLSLEKSGYTQINLFDLTGNLLLKLCEQNLASGETIFSADVSSLSRGIYLVSVDSEFFRKTRKVVVQ